MGVFDEIASRARIAAGRGLKETKKKAGEFTRGLNPFKPSFNNSGSPLPFGPYNNEQRITSQDSNVRKAARLVNSGIKTLKTINTIKTKLTVSVIVIGLLIGFFLVSTVLSFVGVELGGIFNSTSPSRVATNNNIESIRESNLLETCSISSSDPNCIFVRICTSNSLTKPADTREQFIEKCKAENPGYNK